MKDTIMGTTKARAIGLHRESAVVLGSVLALEEHLIKNTQRVVQYYAGLLEYYAAVETEKPQVSVEFQVYAKEEKDMMMRSLQIDHRPYLYDYLSNKETLGFAQVPDSDGDYKAVPVRTNLIGQCLRPLDNPDARQSYLKSQEGNTITYKLFSKTLPTLDQTLRGQTLKK